MEPTALDLLHQPVRLRLMALLCARGDVGASGARAALGVTAGNLDAHARRLEEAGLLVARKVLLRSGFEARYRVTPAGRAAFTAYLAWLEGFLREAQAAAKLSTDPDPPP